MVDAAGEGKRGSKGVGRGNRDGSIEEKTGETSGDTNEMCIELTMENAHLNGMYVRGDDAR